MTEPNTAWRTAGCTIVGDTPNTWCGEPVHGAVVVGTYELPAALAVGEPRPAAVLVCRRHWDGLTAPASPQADTEEGP
jgi:hypothetical protein